MLPVEPALEQAPEILLVHASDFRFESADLQLEVRI